MQLSTVFQISIYGLAAFSGAILAGAEGAVIPALTVPIAILALFFSERWKNIRLSPGWVNALGVLAFLVAGWEFFGPNLEGRLLSGAHLLVYLSWVVLFQDKSTRMYWALCALGVLQVAVAAVLTKDGWFGITLVGYMFASIWTLAVFSLYQAEQQFSRALAYARPSAAGLPARSAAPSTAPPRPAMRTGMAAATARSTARSSIQHDGHARWITAHFCSGILSVAILAFAVGSAFFLLTPRVWIGPRPAFGSGGVERGLRRLTGFSKDVRLGDMGEILENPDPVLSARVFDGQTGRELTVDEYTRRLGYAEPLFRGTSLGRYNRGRWLPAGDFEMPDDLPTMTQWNHIRLSVELERTESDVVFSIGQPEGQYVQGRWPTQVRVELLSGTLYRELPARRETFHYELCLPPLSPPTGDRPVLPVTNPTMYRHLRYPERLLEIPPGLERLKALAQQVATEQTPGNGRIRTPLEQAIALETHLSESGEYEYSLKSALADSSIDPLEDFLFNRKTGHCEYYASALAMMLRAVGIPSRLVTGFKGGYQDPRDGVFRVQQMHAHAWVEALIDAHWVVLDPTPAARDEGLAAANTGQTSGSKLRNLASQFWSSRILNLNLEQQRQELYRPFQDAAKRWGESLRSTGGNAESLFRSIKQFVSSPRRWFSWQGGVFAFVLLTLLSATVWLVRRLYRIGMRLYGRWRPQQIRHRLVVEFYAHLLRILAARGLTRGTAQTQREFAHSVGPRLQPMLASAGLSQVPLGVTELFYRVRFGGEAANEEELQLVKRQLSDLEHSLNGHRADAAHSEARSGR